MEFDYLIIGGGIAGTTAAETIRQNDKDGSICVLSGEPYFLYSRVLLPEFIKGEAGLEKIMLRREADYKKNGIEIFLEESAEIIEPEKMLVQTDKGREIFAKKILVSSGGRPRPWGFETLIPERTFRLHTLDDAKRIKKFLSGRGRDKSGAVVVGGGFIALEFIEILKHYGRKVKLLCKDARFWTDFLDERGSEILSDTWSENGVEQIWNHEIKNKEDENLKADFVGVGIGLERNLTFLDHTGYGPHGPNGSFLDHTGYGPNGLFGLMEANEYMETKYPNVWACGDVAIFKDPFSGRKRPGGNWSGAFMQGRIAGLNIAGGKEMFKTALTYAITHLGLSIAFVGDVGPFNENFGAKSEVIHFDKEKKEYVRIFFKNGAVIGATMINGQKFMGSVNQAIMNKWDVSKVM